MNAPGLYKGGVLHISELEGRAGYPSTWPTVGLLHESRWVRLCWLLGWAAVAEFPRPHPHLREGVCSLFQPHPGPPSSWRGCGSDLL